ncbi:MAG: signal peptidase II [Candidatus Krumholzibacteriota bacterium]|nr:signal peptidase II [Candidatus Krumholzibacteriota bacterium]
MRSTGPRADWILFAAVTAVVVLADWLTKLLVQTGHGLGEYLGGLLRITLISNPGAAFGLLPGARWIFVIVKILAMAVILWLLLRGRAGRGWPRITPLALIFGGALGNLLDRLRPGGAVVDFIDLGVGGHRWYVFNLADACISIGAAWVVILLLATPSPRRGEA